MCHLLPPGRLLSYETASLRRWAPVTCTELSGTLPCQGCTSVSSLVSWVPPCLSLGSLPAMLGVNHLQKVDAHLSQGFSLASLLSGCVLSFIIKHTAPFFLSSPTDMMQVASPPLELASSVTEQTCRLGVIYWAYCTDEMGKCKAAHLASAEPELIPCTSVLST